MPIWIHMYHDWLIEIHVNTGMDATAASKIMINRLARYWSHCGSDHLRRPSSSAACLRDVPGTFFSRQNSTWDRYWRLKHCRRLTTESGSSYVSGLARGMLWAIDAESYPSHIFRDLRKMVLRAGRGKIQWCHRSERDPYREALWSRVFPNSLINNKI